MGILAIGILNKKNQERGVRYMTEPVKCFINKQEYLGSSVDVL